ncbi:MAG: DUF3857 domain-containing protein, partial [Bacteroidota bacterium]
FNETTKQLDLYYLYHTIKYINDNKSIEDNNKIYVQSNESQSIVNVKARVISKGKVIYEATQKDFKEVEEEGRKYNMLAVEGLEKGVVIEYISITKLTEFELYDDDYFQLNAPIKKAEFYLIVPGHTDFRCKSYNGFGNIADSTVDGRHVYYGTSLNIPAIDNEEKYSLVNANKQRIEYVYYYNKETKKMNAKWPELGRTFFDRVNYNYDKNQKDLDKILAKIDLKTAANDVEKVFRIENFLKTNISLDQESEDAPTFMESLKKKAASQYRFNQIMAQAFRKAGIPVEIILTCTKDYKRFDPDFDSWSYLRNVLFYMPSVKQYIDPSQSFKRVGTINTDYLGQDGLFIKIVEIGDAVSATASVKTIAANDVTKSRDEETYTASFNNDLGSLNIHYDRKMNGYSEQGLKSVYFVVDDEKKKEFIEGFVKGLAKDAKLENLKVENYDPTKFDEVYKPFGINADLAADYYVEPVGEGKILLKVGELIGQQSEMYQDKPRFTPIDIDFTHSYNRQIMITIPTGYKVKGLDKLNMNFAYNNAKGQPSFGFISSCKEESGKIMITCTEYYNDITYPVAQFNEFKKVINAAADFNKISILFEK